MAYLAVAMGGFFGAIARFAVTDWVGTVHGFPISTLLINLIGSFILAWFYTFTMERVRVHPTIRLGIGTGFIGAFTTFSTFTVESWHLLTSGVLLWATVYVALTVIGGLFAAFAGYSLAVRQSQLRSTDSTRKGM